MPGFRIAAWLTAAAVVCLLIYGVLQDYHEDPELLITVVVVRFVAGYGLAAVAAAVVAIVMLVRRRPGWLPGFAVSTLSLGALTVIGLVIYNLAEAL